MDTREERNRVKERKRNEAERAKSDGVGRASDGRRDGRLDSITWRTILPRRHCLLEHLLGFSWFGTPSVPYHRVPLHHDILFAYYNTDDDEDESEDEDESNDDEDCYSTDPPRRPWYSRPTRVYSRIFVLYR